MEYISNGKWEKGVDPMDEPLRLGFGTYYSYPYANPNPNCFPYSCKREALKSSAKCLGSSEIWLLAPAGVGIVVTLLLAFGQHDLDGTDQGSTQKGVVAIVIYTAFATLALSLYVYYTLNNHKEHFLTSYLPLSIGLGILLGFYGSVYFFLYRLDPRSFSGDLGDDIITQFLTFIYFSITTFATAQDGDIRAHTLGAKSLVSMEVLSFIYIFTLGIVLLTSS